MSGLVCLRCDWAGSVDPAPSGGDPSCPTCGVPLYVLPRPAPPDAARSPRADAIASSLRPSDDGASSDAPPSDIVPSSGGARRALRAPVFVALIAIVAAPTSSILWRTLVAGGDARAPSGRIVYEGVSAAGERRLWELDLATGAVRPRQAVDGVVELVPVPGDGRGALGYTQVLADGTLEAYVAPSPSAGGRPRRLIGGDLVSWDASGTSVVAARRGDVVGGCHRGVSIAVADLVLATRQRVFFDRRSCADLLAVARSGVRTTVSIDRGGRIGTFSVGRRTFHPEISGHVLAGASPGGDLLVTPAAAGDFPGIAPLRGRARAAAPVARSTGATVVYWPGRGGPAPLGDAGDVVVDRVLAWSDDGSTALAVGDVASIPSVFVTTAVPAAREVARVIARVSGAVTGGALAGDGTAYVAMDGRILESRGGVAAPLAASSAAPRAVGPMTWLP